MGQKRTELEKKSGQLGACEDRENEKGEREVGRERSGQREGQKKGRLG